MKSADPSATKSLHRLLERQIKRCFDSASKIPKNLKMFIEAVNKAYKKMEFEYELLERAQELNEKELEKQIRQKELILSSAAEGIFGINLSGNITFMNSAGANSLGYKNHELIGKNFKSINSKDRNKSASDRGGCPILQNLKEVVFHRIGVTSFLRKDGSSFPVEYTCSSLVEEDMIVGAVIIFEDITERKQAEEKLKLYAREMEHSNSIKDALIEDLQELKKQLEISAKTDHLTKLLNRRGMIEQIDYERLRFHRNKKAFTFVIADIDHFKKINDSFGHDAGDFILSSVAKKLKESLRGQDIVARWGGEEFLILLPETDLSGGILFAEKFRSTIEQSAFLFSKNSLHVTMSFGLSIFETPNMDLDACIKRADECLYKAKSEGRNRVISNS